MSIAVIRNMDTQGRIIIPADIRKETGIRSGSTLEIATDWDNHPHPGSVRPGIPVPKNSGISWSLSIRTSAAGLPSAALTASWASKGCYLPEGAQITEELRSLIQEGREMFSQSGLCPPVPDCSRKVAALFPVTLALASKKAALLLIPEPGRCLSGAECNCTRLIANMITRKCKPNE